MKSKDSYRCGECQATSPRWLGKCPACAAWNSLVEERGSSSAGSGGTPPMPLGQIGAREAEPRPTGVPELDRVLGGGLVPGSVTLLGGEPGVGKSTLLLQALARLAAAGHRCLLVSAEESPQQVRLRAERLEALAPDLWIVADTEVPRLVDHVTATNPAVLVVDSIQTVFDPEVASPPGSIAQVQACAHRLVTLAKARGMSTVLVGHVTKDGSLAGPRALEHLVDTVLSFSGERHHALRLLRATKHRFGATTELGLFEMGEGGLVPLGDAGRYFLADRRPDVPGSVVVPVLDGHRPLMVELQALVSSAGAGVVPRRSAQGLDAGRLGLILAVLDRRAGLRLAGSDVYALAVGGVRVHDPGADVALALAVASSATGRAVPADLVACGELGLGGELRQVPNSERRLCEAARMGFRRAIVPASAPGPPPGIVAVRAGTLSEALATVGIDPRVSGNGRNRRLTLTAVNSP